MVSALDLVERRVEVAGRVLDLLVPRDTDALISEEAFAHEEFLPYWAELWPSALALAAANLADPASRALELGCGLGVVSLTAALHGHDVLATDWAPDAIAILARNAARAGVALPARVFSWTDDPAPLRPPFDRVLAADVLYEARNGDQLLAALPRLTDEVWIADPGRPPAAGFLARAARDWALDRVAHDGPPAVTVHRLRRRAASSG